MTKELDGDRLAGYGQVPLTKDALEVLREESVMEDKIEEGNRELQEVDDDAPNYSAGESDEEDDDEWEEDTDDYGTIDEDEEEDDEDDNDWE